MKKILVIFISLLVISCQKSKTKELTELVYLETITSPGRTRIIQSIIDKYLDQNPDVRLELISPPYEQADNKLTLMLNSNQPLDIIEVRDHTLKQFVNNGKLKDLSPYLSKWEHEKSLLELTNMAARTIDNTPYLLPQFFFVKAMFVRSDVLSRLGYNEVPTTLEDMYRISTEITDPEANQYGFGFRGKGSSFKISDSMILSDVPNIDPDNVYRTTDGQSVFTLPETKEALQAYVELYRNAVPADGINWGFNEQVNAFISGTVPFLIQDPDTVALVNEQLGQDSYTVVPLPVGKSGKSYLDYGFAGLGIPSYTEKADAAWDFISYISSPEQNADFAQAYGPLPVHRITHVDYFSSGVYKAWEETMSDSPDHVFVKYPIDSPKYPGWAQVQEQYMQSLLLGDISVDEALSKWAEYWQ
ncbi:MAG: sugar ABC transporter substrate-binding protein [Spirochaetota bacterium]